MKILVDIGHPANVHFFKNIIRLLEKEGNEVKITLRNRDVAKYLLNIYGFEYETLVERHYKGVLNKAIGMLKIDYKLYKVAKKFGPDILTGEDFFYIAPVSKLLRKPSIVFINNEMGFYNKLFSRFADVICTSKSFNESFDSKKHIKYDGYYFGAYLHPSYFKPDPSVLEDLCLNKDEKFFILRFRTYDAFHDIRHRGFHADRLKLAKELEEHGRVLILSDSELGGELEKYRIPPSERLHDLLYFAYMCIGDGFSTAAEAAILGTPSILVSTIDRGYIKELRDRYNLVITCKNSEEAHEIVRSLLEKSDLKKEWRRRARKMQSEKIDVVKFVVDLIKRYPESVSEYIEQNKWK